MKGMLVVGFVTLSIVGFGLAFVATQHMITRIAGVRKRDNAALRLQLVQANDVILTVKSKVDDIGDLNPILAGAVRPLVDNYLITNGSKVK